MASKVTRSDSLLDPVAAAARLDVSPELLFYYSRRDTQTVHGRFRLKATTSNGGTFFAPEDLDAFDLRLSEPRSAPGEPRARIDAAVTAHLKVEAGGACARCGSGVAVESAHIVPYRESHSNHHRNLLRLCPACHGEFDSSVVDRSEIEAIKLRLMAVGRQRLIASGKIEVRDLPPRHRLFGRSEELARLVVALQSDHTLMVRGIGGIGKTQLVLHAVNAAQTGRPVVWVALEDCSSEAVLRAYMEAAASKIASGDLIKTLASIRACVVLDGIERAACGVATVSRVISELMSDGLGIQLVVTSQARLPEIAFETELQVERLDLEASARMLPTPECGREGVSQLLQFADGHPLTLRIVAALVRHFGSTSEVIGRLHGRPERPLEMPARTTQGTDSSLDICLQTAFEALGEGERSAMWALAHLPAGLATAFVSLEALGVDDPAQVTAELKRWHLVERRELTGEPLLWVLSPVRSYVRRAIDERTLPELSTLRRRLAWHFAARVEEVNSDLIHGGHIELGMALLDRELPNALAVFDLSSGKAADDAGFRAIANALASTLQTYFFSSGYFDVGAAVMERAADLAIAAGDTREALEMLSQLISLANRGRRTDLAEAALEKARALDCTVDPLAQAFMLGIEADLERTVGRESRWDRRDGRIKAAVAARRSYELLVQAAGGVLTHRAALALLQQACHLEDAGRPDQALPLLERAVIFFRSDEDPINAGSALQRRGNCLAYVGRITESMDSYAESAELFHKLKTVEYRSNALGEAGLLMAEHAEVVCSPQITDDVLIGGIDDIVDRIVEAVPLIRVPGNDWRYVLTRKACGMIILASLSGRTACLAQMGHRLRNEVAQVLFTREPEKWRRIGHGSPVTAHFSALAWLCEHISGISPPDRAPDLSEIERLAIIAESMLTGDMRDLMFGWLARYLAEQRGLSGLSPGILRAATDGLGYGEPFELDGFIFSHS